jgi:hypothetical protein
VEAEQAQTAAVQAHSLEAQAYAHAEAQAHTIAHVHSLEAQAHAHAQQVLPARMDPACVLTTAWRGCHWLPSNRMGLS